MSARLIEMVRRRANQAYDNTKTYMKKFDFAERHFEARSSAGESAFIKVDHVLQALDKIFVLGWTSEPTSKLHLVDQDGHMKAVRRAAHRPDVAAFLKRLPKQGQYGFILETSEMPNGTASLIWTPPDGQAFHSTPLTVETAASEDMLGHLGEFLLQALVQHEVGSPGWRKALSAFPPATALTPGEQGAIDVGVAGQQGGSVISGWVIRDEPGQMWIDDGAGGVSSLDDALWFERPDVLALPLFANALNSQIGFVKRVPGLNMGGQGALYSATRHGVRRLATTTITKTLSDNPKAAASELFAIGASRASAKRAVNIDLPMLQPIIDRRSRAVELLHADEHVLGASCETAVVSLVIPLYGRMDFVEHQLMCFSKDEFIKTNCEIIYVVDDERLLRAMHGSVDELHMVYNVPFKWIWGQTNRGFSAANNLGISVSKGDKILFLNSDVFPENPGWLENLVKALDDNTDIGIVGPRLLFAEGGIQHAGMISRRLEAAGIWINHHSLMGFSPKDDAHKDLARVELITGACALMRRADIDRLGGWDTGYLIGDFEDSDLCFKIRAAGMTVGYLPTVELIHLERQSFKLMGENDFRSKVTMVNAARHQTRWPQFLAQKY